MNSPIQSDSLNTNRVQLLSMQYENRAAEPLSPIPQKKSTPPTPRGAKKPDSPPEVSEFKTFYKKSLSKLIS